MTTPDEIQSQEHNTAFYKTPKILQVMAQYRITTTINNRESAVNYDSRETAVKRWNEIREIYAYFGYTIADACGDDIDNGGLAELWIKTGHSSRNIEIWPIQE